MAVTGDLNFNMTLTGDTESTDIFSYIQNTTSPGQIEVINLATGDNTITVPTGGGSEAKACIIFPPNNNTQTITIKGNTGDTGVLLNKVNPACISLDVGVTSFILTAGGTVAGVRFYFV